MKNNLRVERARLRLTQQELAQQTGVTRQTIVAIEQGRFNPSVILALKMARVFNTSVETLFELETTD
ncbi:MAG: helix-turn-helix transcriptional regulator [Bacteroidaceae bacterium]|jgi:putative transcriptional regulator|nr:helix-turn-helix transcriptional regulator [Bacteroidaceae bacterium]MBQ5573245.1 helix-turn-helix transcriptional regulator [Bacteroidaceae bacterium]MBR4303592.1 helix-turn-helix transcriptional regulator [Bacteroidaceae bacterium]